MEVANRSYLTTGVAVVGATAIALAPLQLAPPDFYARGDAIVSQLSDVSLTALSDVIAALEAVWNPVATGIDTAVSGSQGAINAVGDALQAALVDGLAQGNTAFQSLVDGLLDQGGALATAIDDAIAAAPSPSAFITTLVSAFAAINANLAGAFQLALQATLDVSGNITLDATAIANALQDAAANLAAQFNAAVAAFPTPADFVDALTGAFASALPQLDAAAAAAQAAVTALSNALANTINAGIAAGSTALQALINGLVNGTDQLATAFQNLVAEFPTPQEFVNALVAAFARISPEVAVQLFIALRAMISVDVNIDLADIGAALVNAGEQLADAFNALVAGFPTPQAFAAALSGALSAFVPAIREALTAGQAAIADLSAALASAINAGLAAGSTAFQSLVDGLNTVGSQLQMAFQSALAAFPTPQEFLDALVTAFNQIGANVGAQLSIAIQAVIDIGATIDAAAIVDALVSAGADLAAAFNAVVASFPTPEEFATALNSALGPVLAGINTAIDNGQELVTNLVTAGADALVAALGQLPSPEVIAGGLARAVVELQASLEAGLSSLPSAADAVAAAQILSDSINQAVGYVAAIGVTAVTEFSDAFRDTAVAALNNGADAVQAITTGLVAALARLTRTELPSATATVQASVNQAASVNRAAADEVTSTKVTTERPTVTLPIPAATPVRTPSPAKAKVPVDPGLATVGSQVQGAITVSEKQVQTAVQDVGKRLQTAGDDVGKQIDNATAGVRKSLKNAVKAFTPKPPTKPATKPAKKPEKKAEKASTGSTS
jgi:trimeric autotransporter adhesin